MNWFLQALWVTGREYKTLLMLWSHKTESLKWRAMTQTATVPLSEDTCAFWGLPSKDWHNNSKTSKTLQPVSSTRVYLRCMQAALSLVIVRGIGILPYLDEKLHPLRSWPSGTYSTQSLSLWWTQRRFLILKSAKQFNSINESHLIIWHGLVPQESTAYTNCFSPFTSLYWDVVCEWSNWSSANIYYFKLIAMNTRTFVSFCNAWKGSHSSDISKNRNDLPLREQAYIDLERLGCLVLL